MGEKPLGFFLKAIKGQQRKAQSFFQFLWEIRGGFETELGLTHLINWKLGYYSLFYYYFIVLLYHCERLDMRKFSDSLPTRTVNVRTKGKTLLHWFALMLKVWHKERSDGRGTEPLPCLLKSALGWWTTGRWQLVVFYSPWGKSFL